MKSHLIDVPSGADPVIEDELSELTFAGVVGKLAEEHPLKDQNSYFIVIHICMNCTVPDFTN